MSSNTDAAVHQVHRDDVGAKMGMWLFLFTEILLFGGMFLVYAVYRYQYPDQFHIAGMELNTGIGTLNTIILLTSSLTVALSIAALQRENKLDTDILFKKAFITLQYRNINYIYEFNNTYPYLDVIAYIGMAWERYRNARSLKGITSPSIIDYFIFDLRGNFIH